MNWSGGYKHRFRPNTEIRKTAFQQQSRIVLVDLVKHDGLEQTSQSHISDNNEQEFPMISPKKEALSNDDVPFQHFGTPFHNIPCGSSSDTDESGNDELSNTNYSPFSLGQESTTDHHIANMSEGNQVNVPSSHMVDEDYEDSNPNEVLFPQQSSQSGFSSVECLSPPPYLNPNSYFSTSNLSFLTPVIHRENTVGYSTIDERFCEPGLDHNNSDLRNLPHSTSLTDKTVIQENSIFKTPVQKDSRKSPSTTKCSMFVPVNVTPVHRKQVHFYSSDQESTTENRCRNFSERNQVNESSPVREQYENSGVNTPRNRCTLRISPADPCSTPAPYYVNQRFNYPTPSLGSSTTEIHHENFEGFSTIDQDQRIPRLKVSTVHNLPYSTPINTGKKRSTVFQKTPIQSKAVNHNVPDQANCSMFPAFVGTPAQRKQVQFAPSVSLQKLKVIVNNTAIPIKEISNLNPLMPSTSGTSLINGSTMDLLECQTSTSPPNKEEQSVVITEGTVSAQHDYCKEETICLVQSASEIVTIDPLPSPVRSQERITNTHENRNKLQANPKSANQKRKQCATPSKTSTSFRKKLHGKCIQHCRCRTVIRKIKIRDAETQTSP